MLATSLDLYNECCILQGQMAESRAKAKLFLARLKSNPEQVDDMTAELEKLEVEMIDHIQAIATMDQRCLSL